MKIIPLIDRTGNVKAWADPETSWIIDLTGKAFAFVSFDGIFNRQGIQVGWWQGDNIRNRYGYVVLIRPDVTIDGILKIPLLKTLPTPPKAHLPTSSPGVDTVATATFEETSVGGLHFSAPSHLIRRRLRFA